MPNDWTTLTGARNLVLLRLAECVAVPLDEVDERNLAIAVTRVSP